MDSETEAKRRSTVLWVVGLATLGLIFEALSRCRAQARRVAHRLMSGGDTGRIAPRLERFGAEVAVSASRDEMTRNGEDVVGGCVQGQEPLG
jgi:hypothetical protein